MPWQSTSAGPVSGAGTLSFCLHQGHTRLSKILHQPRMEDSTRNPFAAQEEWLLCRTDWSTESRKYHHCPVGRRGHVLLWELRKEEQIGNWGSRLKVRGMDLRMSPQWSYPASDTAARLTATSGDAKTTHVLKGMAPPCLKLISDYSSVLRSQGKTSHYSSLFSVNSSSPTLIPVLPGLFKWSHNWPLRTAIQGEGKR